MLTRIVIKAPDKNKKSINLERDLALSGGRVCNRKRWEDEED
jgi:hypothetical protein